MFDKVIIVLHYISKESLFKKVENLNLNRELNELAQDKRLRLTNATYNKLDKKKEFNVKKYCHKKYEENYLPTTTNYLKELITGV